MVSSPLPISDSQSARKRLSVRPVARGMAHSQERTLGHLDHLHETTIMSAHVLVSGTLFRAPEERTGKTSGKHFVAATVKVRDGDSGRILGAHLVGPHADE